MNFASIKNVIIHRHYYAKHVEKNFYKTIGTGTYCIDAAFRSHFFRKIRYYG